MHGKPTGTFRDDARYRSLPMTVEFTLDLRDDSGTRPIRCRVTWEVLTDAAGTREPASAERALALYRELRERVHAAVDRKLKLGELEADGSLTVTSEDFA